MNIKVKKLHPDAIIPSYAKIGDAGLDLTAVSMTENDLYIEYGTGLSFELPSGYVGLIYPRSSLSNYDLVLSNHVGVVDSGFRGEVKFRFKKTENLRHAVQGVYYKVGDRVGQLVVTQIPSIVLTEVENLDETERGGRGFGSSGN